MIRGDRGRIFGLVLRGKGTELRRLPRASLQNHRVMSRFAQPLGGDKMATLGVATVRTKGKHRKPKPFLAYGGGRESF